MPDLILALNAGSSSIKHGLFALAGSDSPVEVDRGETDDDGKDPSALEGALSKLLERVEGAGTLVGIGHRIVHGGERFVDPVLLDDGVVDALDALTPLAPLHQPRSLAPVRAMKLVRPGIPQIGCFDTAFHHGLTPPVSRFALPRLYEEKGLRRYGFHGLSYAYIARHLVDISPAVSARRTVVAHLGNGASLCAMRDGKSIDTTMGFTALDGLVMGTRCGTIDPGIMLWLQQSGGLDVNQLQRLLYHESGLLGVSGISGDMRVLLSSSDPRAADAVDLFAFSAARGVAIMAHTMGGLECLVFTGGIGQHAKEIRALVCERLAWLGVSIDRTANDRGADIIGGSDSRVDVRVIATDEELTIARNVLDVLSPEVRSA
jgi:acetate kinase